ncbi:MAG: CinA family nicotinamide mononucleotide deamidase-related protein [Candidatus Delongbacteria bacterium]|nr:CinA family nicotinamide mononucleotide deamidase-related protein [Candidatus Delongbacteria bacterium]
MKACIITIGNEILTGRIINTNVRHMSAGLYRAGFSVAMHYDVADDQSQIIRYLDQAFREASIVMVCGGLGPTTDDITRESVAAWLGSPLVFSSELYAPLEERYRKLNRQVPESNRKQAMIPESCRALPNSVGMAYGIWWEDKSRCLAVMPGVPRELEAMFDQAVLPRLAEKYRLEPERNLLIRTIRIPESMLMEQIQPVMDQYGIDPDRIGFYPSFSGVDILYHDTRLDSGFCDAIRRLFKSNIYSDRSESLMEVVQRRMIEKGSRLAVAESCTGGLVGKLITDIPGSSRYFWGGMIAYHNRVKIQCLGVSPETLKSFGAVSRETAGEMLKGLLKLDLSDYGIAITGHAGPIQSSSAVDMRDGIDSPSGNSGDDQPEPERVPVGKVWIACGNQTRSIIRDYQMIGTREAIRHRTAYTAFFQLVELLDQS